MELETVKRMFKSNFYFEPIFMYLLEQFLCSTFAINILSLNVDNGIVITNFRFEFKSSYKFFNKKTKSFSFKVKSATNL